MSLRMANLNSDLARLKVENRLLRQAVSDAQRHLEIAAKLHEHEFAEKSTMEIRAAIDAAAKALADAPVNLRRSDDERTKGPIPDGPTQRQGQFLAYIREYMLRNEGQAPTHLEFQKFFQLTPPSVNSMLKRLDQKGFIRRIPGRPRAIQLSIDPEFIPELDRPFKH
jgi:hypothetical protein